MPVSKSSVQSQTKCTIGKDGAKYYFRAGKRVSKATVTEPVVCHKSSKKKSTKKSPALSASPTRSPQKSSPSELRRSSPRLKESLSPVLFRPYQEFAPRGEVVINMVQGSPLPSPVLSPVSPLKPRSPPLSGFIKREDVQNIVLPPKFKLKVKREKSKEIKRRSKKKKQIPPESASPLVLKESPVVDSFARTSPKGVYLWGMGRKTIDGHRVLIPAHFFGKYDKNFYQIAKDESKLKRFAKALKKEFPGIGTVVYVTDKQTSEKIQNLLETSTKWNPDHWAWYYTSDYVHFIKPKLVPFHLPE